MRAIETNGAYRMDAGRVSWGLLVLLASVPCLAGGDPEPFFPIMAWNDTPGDPAVLAKMRECGITVAGFVKPEGLDACHAAGLKAIVSDGRVKGYDWTKVDPDRARARVSRLIREVRDHPAVYGYYLRDEPSADLFPGLATVSEIVRELHPGAWPYINLYPNHASPELLGAASYEEYLDRFIEACRPPILSYDHYALMEGGGFRDGYFANLELLRARAQAHGIPLWNIILATACIDYREVSATDLRFQVYTSLAYGVRGIAWFTYFAPRVGNFRMAPIDQFGHETATWRSMQNINLQVAKLAPTLLGLRSDLVYHFGEVPPGCAGPNERGLVEAVHGPMLVGDFTHRDGSRYVMIVNRDFTHSSPCRPRFRSRPAELKMVSPYTGGLIAFQREQTWLAPGQGVLLKLIR